MLLSSIVRMARQDWCRWDQGTLPVVQGGPLGAGRWRTTVLLHIHRCFCLRLPYALR